MALEPAAIARAIHDRDARALQRLPEIGPKLAELIVHELKAKVEPFTRAIGTGAAVSGAAGGQAAGGAAREPTVEPKSPRRGRARAAEPSAPPPPPAPVAPIRQTVETLIALGESPADAERMVGRVIDQARANGEAPPSTSQALLAAAYATR
jgi:Holliday junction resolvasome RuvABC DNA-binding subunit